MAEYNNNNQNYYNLLFGCSLSNQKPMCCSGRNSSCKSREYPTTQTSTIYKFNVHPSDISPVYCRPKRKINKMSKYSLPLQKRIMTENNTTRNKELSSLESIFDEQKPIRIGFTNIFPGLIAIEPAGQQLLNSLGINISNEKYLRLFEFSKPKKKRKSRRKRLSKGQDEEFPKELNNDFVFQFGWPVEHWDIENYDKLITDEQGWPLIRYSLLNKYLPLRVLKRSHTIDLVKGRQRQYWHTFNLAEAQKECFCDQICVKYGDCCRDYAQRCPAFDCLISQWNAWSDCIELPNKNCGLGFRERHRQILKPAENSGIECPTELKQEIGCFKQCEAKMDETGEIEEDVEFKPDVTTVALLLDYKFNKSRKFLPRYLKKNQLGFIRRRVKHNWQYKKYCVIYTIEWLNRNCIELEWRNKLAINKRICAECQPEAQYHRPRARCASNLEDGQTGFWKLIGPTSCYGIWRRHYSDNNECNCSQSYSEFEPFLLV